VPAIRPFVSYVICTSPRSGSTLLCSLLDRTGVAGCPDSHFHAPSLDRWLAEYGFEADRFACEGDAMRAVVSAARQRGTGDTGIFGLRLQQASFGYFMERLRGIFPDCSSDVTRIEAAFGRTLFIHLCRRNKVEQAVSLVKARQTGLWHKAPDGTELERLSPPKAPVYDHAEIARQVSGLSAMDAAWEAWFDAENVAPLRLSYDDLATDHRAALSRVLTALGVKAGPVPMTPPLARLSDRVNRAWVARYCREEGGR